MIQRYFTWMPRHLIGPEARQQGSRTHSCMTRYRWDMLSKMSSSETMLGCLILKKTNRQKYLLLDFTHAYCQSVTRWHYCCTIPNTEPPAFSSTEEYLQHVGIKPVCMPLSSRTNWKLLSDHTQSVFVSRMTSCLHLLLESLLMTELWRRQLQHLTE